MEEANGNIKERISRRRKVATIPSLPVSILHC